jgi:predicted secreted protein
MTAMKTYGRDASTIEASAGDAFAIELEGTPGAGYQWHAAVPAGVVRMRHRKVHPSPSMGGSAKESLTFEALEPGETTIRLEYKRPWEENAHESRDIKVKVT